jgi:FkbM family methyltransferase
MMDGLRYHALMCAYGILRGLGLMTGQEREEKNAILRHSFAPEPKATFVAHRGSCFRQRFCEWLDKNREAVPHKYLALIDGLDEESRSTVCIALQRIMKLYHVKGPWRRATFRLTPSELLAIKKERDALASGVVRLPNGVWAYKGWLLPHWRLLSEAIVHRHFIEELGHLRKIRGRDILDVGGFIGDSALVLSGYTDKNVYSFDPNPKNIEKMRETMRLNRTGAKIVPVPLGLGDREDTLLMPADDVSGYETFSGHGARKGAPAKMTTLDEWAQGSGADIGLVKVDIEGQEQMFLKGAVETIRRHRPAMLLCIYHNASDLFEIKPFVEGLGLGYRFKVRQPPGHYIGEMVLICEAP